MLVRMHTSAKARSETHIALTPNFILEPAVGSSSKPQLGNREVRDVAYYEVCGHSS